MNKLTALVLVAIAGLVVSSANGGTWTWTDTAGVWSDPNNWVEGVPGPSGSDNTDVLNFGNTQATSYTSQNDLGAPTIINQLNASSTSPANSIDIVGDQIQFAGTTPSLNQNGTGALTVANDIDLATSTTFGGTGSGVVTVDGNITSAIGASLTKASVGYLYLNGNSAVDGGVNLNSGTLAGSGAVSGGVTINGGARLAGNLTVSNGATINSGAVLGSVNISDGATVNSGGVLAIGSAGQVTGGLTVKNGGALTPGSGGIATINADSVTLSGGGHYGWNLGNPLGVAGTGWDLLSVSGLLDFLNLGPTSKFIFDIYGPPTPGTYIVATASSINTFNAAYFTLNNFAGGSGRWSIGQIAYGGGQALELTYSIPEPSMALLWVTGFGILGVYFLKRRSAMA